MSEIKFISEDNKNSPSSKFISACHDVIFSGGNQNLYSTVLLYDYCIVLMDLVPDNELTHKVYRKLVETRKQGEWNGILIPIPCIEYVLLDRYFVRYGKRLPESNVFLEYGKQCYSLPYEKSFEKFCKTFYGNSMPKCFKGKNPNYLIMDCICQYCDIQELKGLSLQSKSKALWENSLHIVDTAFSEAREYFVKLYNNAARLQYDGTKPLFLIED